MRWIPEILEDIVHVTVFALYRYVILVHPRHIGVVLVHRYSVVAILVIMYFVPSVLILMQFVTMLIQTDVYHRDVVVFNRYTMFCSLVPHSEFQHIGIVKKFGVVSLCAAIVGFSYARIYFLVWRRGRRLNSIGGSFNRVRLHHELSLLKTAVGTFLTFAVSYLPMTVVYGLDTERTLPYEVYFVGVMLMWLSPSINWVVYGFMNAKFAKAYRYIFCAENTSTSSLQRRRTLACPTKKIPVSTYPFTAKLGPGLPIHK